MKKILLISCVALLLGGCRVVDPVDWKPVYYIVNHSDNVVDFAYVLKPSVAEMGNAMTGTLRINTNDTLCVYLPGRYEKDELLRPASVFSRMAFLSLSGDVLFETSHINNEDWRSCPLRDGDPQAWEFAVGWLYEYK